MCPRTIDVAVGDSSGAEVQSQCPAWMACGLQMPAWQPLLRHLRPRLASTGILLLELRAWVEEAQTTPEGS